MKNNIELILEIRKSWTINPRTRVHDNNMKKNKKKQRQEARNLSRDYLKSVH
ncbi:MAG: hypothetical protein N2645_23815 [Clostridia bacterium]|nr:hypothetical protein [Clostridia bacterium]